MVDTLGVVYSRSKELLLRWMELNAVADSIFRSHLGSIPGDSWQINSDNATLTCFARMATLHRMFAPYRQGLLAFQLLRRCLIAAVLMAAAATNGTPIVQPLWLQYSTDAVVRTSVCMHSVIPVHRR